MNSVITGFTALTTALFLGATSARAQSNPCGILSSAEATKHVARGQPTYGQTPDAVQVAGGMLCEYPFGGQVGVWNSAQELEGFLKRWNAAKAARHPVPGVGDKAWIMFPAPRDQYQDRPAYLVTHVGAKVYTIALFAHDGAADGPMGAVCRGDQSRLKADERKDCQKILADKSETQESLQPAVVELAKLVVTKVRAGNGK